MGWPSDRRMTKSSMSDASKSIGPCTRSSTRTDPAGTLKRTARGFPAFSRAAISSGRQTETRALVLVFGIAFALRLQLLRRAVAVVRMPLRDQRLRRLQILRLPLRLKVRRVRTGHHRPLVPVEAEPAQAVENALDHRLRRPLDVGVLDAQHEHAAMPARKQPVEQRRPGAADVQVAGRRRREPAGRRHNMQLYSRCDHDHDAQRRER